MTTRAVEQIDGWDSRSFSGGYRGLHDLSSDGFSGIVAAGPTRLCMTKGRVVGVLDGDIEAFEGASGTVYEAPSPALPLLAVMQERSDEVRAQYYTEDTPLSEVDRTLADGNFTGYVELSENVLSGDYYQVYHAGQSMSVAFVGAHGELLSDDKAFEKANDEVGIYEVRPVEVDVIEIPEAEEPADGTGGAATAPAAADSDDSESDDAVDADDTDDAAAESAADTATDATTEADATGTQRAATGDESSETAASESATDRQRREAESDGTPTDADQSADARTADSTPEPSDRAAESGHRTAERDAGTGSPDRGADASASESRAGRSETPAEDRGREQRQADDSDRRGSGTQPNRRREPGGSRPTGRGGGGPGQQPSGGVADLETRSIPSLDPDRTAIPDSGAAGTAGAAAGATGQRQNQPRHGNDAASGQPSGAHSDPGRSARDQPAQTRTDQPQDERGQQTAHSGNRDRHPDDQPQSGAPQEPSTGTDPAEIERLEAELDDREDEIERLEAELETVEDEREELASELETAREERDELESQVESLEQRVNELRAESGGESIADRQRLSPGEAIDQTNLFVRYKSKGEATLEKAHAGGAEAGAVNDNLEIQHHTQFDADDAAVNGEPFGDYLTDTIQYRFVEWVVRVLPYEIRDTGHENALQDLYDALPRLDRAELNGSVSVQYQEDGETHRSQERFDVVLRDRMGNPLAVANMNESRDPATGDMMESLITAGTRVGESKESLAGGFLVTSSFFEPEAMEAASAATGGGLLSRDSRESYVRLSRKDGFHLCLVEARGQNFNLSVPEI